MKSAPPPRRDIIMAQTTEDEERIEQRPDEPRQSLQKPQDEDPAAAKDQNRKSMEPYSPEIFLG